MDPFTIGTNILGVAKSLLGINDRLKAAKQDRKDKISKLYEGISDCLVRVSNDIRSGNTPYGACQELVEYAGELPGLIKADVGDEKAKALGKTLHSAYNVEGMANDLSKEYDKEPYLKIIEEASGKFRAMANILRAS